MKRWFAVVLLLAALALATTVHAGPHTTGAGQVNVAPANILPEYDTPY